MDSILLILRAQPGAERTAKRAMTMGLKSIQAPLFSIRPLDWELPDLSGFKAVMITSANAALHGGERLRALNHLPCYAVGETSAAAARRRRFDDVRTGPGDGGDLVRMAANDGIGRILHLCGAERNDYAHPELEIETVPVYRTEAEASLPGPAREAIAAGVIPLIHSPRSGALFARLFDEAGLDRRFVTLAAISSAAAVAAGGGWRSTRWPGTPRDQALLELALHLCNTDGDVDRNSL